MADSSILKPFILSFEGGYSNKKSDRGGATMKGVTLETFRKVYGANKTASDLKKITDEQWHRVKNIIIHSKIGRPPKGDQIMLNAKCAAYSPNRHFPR